MRYVSAPTGFRLAHVLAISLLASLAMFGVVPSLPSVAGSGMSVVALNDVASPTDIGWD